MTPTPVIAALRSANPVREHDNADRAGRREAGGPEVAGRPIHPVAMQRACCSQRHVARTTTVILASHETALRIRGPYRTTHGRPLRYRSSANQLLLIAQSTSPLGRRVPARGCRTAWLQVWLPGRVVERM